MICCPHCGAFLQAGKVAVEVWPSLFGGDAQRDTRHLATYHKKGLFLLITTQLEEREILSEALSTHMWVVLKTHFFCLWFKNKFPHTH